MSDFRATEEYKKAMDGVGMIARTIENTMDFVLSTKDEKARDICIKGMNQLVDRVLPIVQELANDRRLIAR